MSFHVYKWLGSLTDPMNAVAVFLFLGGLLVCLPWERGQRIGRRLAFAVGLFLVLLAFLPLGQWALLPLENRYKSVLPEKVDGIVMLTGDESPSLSEARGVPISGMAAQRHIAFARLARRYPKAQLVAVGDTGPFHQGGKVTTKSLLQDDFDAMGVPRERVEYETKSLTTYENAKFTKALVKPKDGETWLLLTSAFHMPRAVLCFEKQGWTVVPFPTDYMTPPWPLRPHALDLERQARFLSRAAHEYAGLISYWLAGWIERPWR